MAIPYSPNTPEDMVRDLLVEAAAKDERVDTAINPAIFGLSNKKGLAMLKLADGTVLSFVVAKVQVMVVSNSDDNVSPETVEDETDNE